MHNLTTQQAEALKQFDRFIASPARCFIVKGYAGTGKTFLIGQMAQRLAKDHIPAMLLAPTGRAARVLSHNTGFPASTIHRAIYNLADLIEGNDEVGGFKFYYRLKDSSTDNLSVVAFVDEASMLSDNYSEGEFLRFGSGRLLADLLQYLRIESPTQKSKLVVIGDPAQLPPVNMPISPALDSSYLEEQYGLQVNQVELTEVVRQTSDSPILKEATKIRKTLDSRIYNQLYVEQMPPHITEIKMEDLPTRLVSANQNTSLPCAICLAYSNATCFNVNIAIRSKLFGGNGLQPPYKSDILLVIRNNAKTGLLNGDQIYVLEAAQQAQMIDVPVGAKHIRLTFRDVRILKEADDGSTLEFETKLIENVLYSEKRDLSPDELKALFISFKIRHPRLRPNTKEFTEVLRDDTYFNALQVKYGYAMTCHKAQGGEWDEVFVIFENHRTDALALRWAYTALTRARIRITGVNLPRVKPWSAIPLGGTSKVDQPPLPIIKENHIGVGSEVNPKPTCWDSQFPSEPTFIKFLHQRIAFSLTQSGIAIDDVIVRATNYFWRYSVSRSMKRANVQVYFNSKGAVRPQILPNTASDTEFAENVINIITGAANAPYPTEEIKIDFPDNKPHLREFFENYIEPRVSMHSCHVTKVEHLQFRERYYISSSESRTVIDAIYSSRGSFHSLSWSSGDQYLSNLLLSDD